MLTKILKNRIILTLLLSCVVIWILVVFSSVFHVLNKNIQNNYYSLKNTIFDQSVNSNILIATIDKETLWELGRFPFSRDVYVEFLKNVERQWAAVVGFDIIFVDESDQSADLAFTDALERANIPIVFGSSITSSSDIETPLPLFQNTIFSSGFLPPNVDRANRTVYSFSPFLRFDSGEYEHFSLAVLRGFYSFLYDQDLRKDTFEFDAGGNYLFTEDLRIPLSSRGVNDVLISFLPSEAFPQVPFSDLQDHQKSKEHDLKDKIILIGTTVDGIKDEFFMPSGLEYGVFVHANIINTILSKQFLIYFDKKTEWILIFLLIITSVYFNLSRSRKILFASNVLLAGLFVIIIPVSIFLFTNLIMSYPTEIVFALILSQTLSNGVKYLIEDKNKEKLKKSLSEYVGSDIAEEVLNEWGNINFDGEEKDAILFFSDIEWFTTLSEKLTPRKLVGFLREYLGQMSDVVLDQKGYINKYEGDAIMAIWWAFGELEPQNYSHACHAALEQMELLEKLNKDWLKHYGQKIHIRIGIHSGEVIVWNIGAEGRKMEFTALWDTVNIASRLEWVNKFYGIHICVSESIYTETKGDFEYRFLDTIKVKWKKEQLNIYELIGRKWELSEKNKKIREKFQVALDVYTKQDFQKAKLLFNELIDMWDPAALTFKARCSMYLLNPPEKDWKGVWIMDEK